MKIADFLWPRSRTGPGAHRPGLPVQGPAPAKRGRHAPERLLPPQHSLALLGGRHRHSPAPRLIGMVKQPTIVRWPDYGSAPPPAVRTASDYPCYDDRIRRPASSSISLTQAPCITSPWTL